MNTSDQKIIIILGYFLILLTAAHGQNVWLEGWENGPIGALVPNDISPAFINADKGRWFVADTVSSFLDDDCGPDLNKAEIVQFGAVCMQCHIN